MTRSISGVRNEEWSGVGLRPRSTALKPYCRPRNLKTTCQVRQRMIYLYNILWKEVIKIWSVIRCFLAWDKAIFTSLYLVALPAIIGLRLRCWENSYIAYWMEVNKRLMYEDFRGYQVVSWNTSFQMGTMARLTSSYWIGAGLNTYYQRYWHDFAVNVRKSCSNKTLEANKLQLIYSKNPWWRPPRR